MAGSNPRTDNLSRIETGDELEAIRDRDDYRAVAVELILKDMAETRGSVPAESSKLAVALARQGLMLLKVKAWIDAEPLLRESVAIRVKLTPNVWNTFEVKSRLGSSLLGQKKYADAETLLLESYAGLKQRKSAIPANEQHCLPDCVDHLIELYTDWGKTDQLEEWRRKRDQKSSNAPAGQ